MPIAKLERKNHPAQYKYFDNHNAVLDYKDSNPHTRVILCPASSEPKGFDKTVDYKMMKRLTFGNQFTYADMKMAERIAGKINGFYRLTNEERLFLKEWREAELEEEGVLLV